MALTVPFTFGHIMRVFGRKGFYLKNAESIEELANIDTLVFDKTGTLTHLRQAEVAFSGGSLSTPEKQLLAALAGNSAHPVSTAIAQAIGHLDGDVLISNWHESIGQGISATVNGHEVAFEKNAEAGTNVRIDGQIRGTYETNQQLRTDAPELLKTLSAKFNLYMLSGDGMRQEALLQPIFESGHLHFRQSPTQKLAFVEQLKKHGKRVLMMGDGLNDAGALRAANFGVTITDDTNGFTPAADAILDARSLGLLPRMVAMAKSARRLIYGSFLFSLAYNLVGIGFAAQGLLHPMVAAILMPVSSITVLLYAWLGTTYLKHKHKLT